MILKKNVSCPNCGNDFKSEFDYCPHCGQKNKEFKLNFKYLLNDFLSGSFNIDSKFFSTFRYLILKPAFLTREFLNGKRAKYLTPLRLYLLVSFAYFAVLSLTNNSALKFKETDSKEEIPVIFSDSEQDTLAVMSDSLLSEQSEAISFESEFDNDSTLLGIETKTLKSLNSKKGRQAFRDNFNEYMSISMFFIMPFAALFLFWFFGRGTYYLEHLIFLIHLQSLVFLIMLFFGLVEYYLPFSFISSIEEILILLSIFIWIKSFYNFKWIKSIFSTILFFISYIFILGISFVILAWFSLLIL